MDTKSDALEQGFLRTASSHRLRPTRKREQHLDGSKPDTIHERLDDPSGQIRLLVATASSQNDILSFEISTHPLADAPTYHAISYTWGQDQTQRSVIINGVDFSVNQNCYYALWQACSHYSNSLLWIDSLCIDQGDSAEKSAQVWIMPEIYSGAARVLACVGPHADNSMMLVAAIPELERLRQLEEALNDTLSESEDEVKDFPQLVFESLGQDSFSDLFWAFCRFRQRLYWKRVWIQQEIGLAADLDILCGDGILFSRGMKLHDELYIASLVRKLGLFSEADQVRIDTEEALRAYAPFEQIIDLGKEGVIGFGALLSLSAGLECEDFHDRVYGVLGLTSSSTRNYLLPNYDLTATQLAMQVAIVLPFYRGEVIIQNLGTEIGDEELRLLVERVHGCDATWNDVAPEKRPRCSCYPMREHREYQMKEVGAVVPSYQAFAFCRQYTVRTDGDGQLTIDLEDSTYFEKGSFNKDHDNLSTQALLSGAKRIVVNDRIVGFVCQTARDGDAILNLLGMNSGNFLVLRHSTGEFYDLVGWGFLLPGYCLSLIDVPVGKGLELAFGAKAVEVRISISPQETIAFWAMEAQERETEGLERTIDMVARLDAPITNHPHGAVHVRDQPID